MLTAENFSGVPNLQICNNSLCTYPLVITSIKRTLRITTMSNEEEKGRTNGSKIALNNNNNSNSKSKISLNVSHGTTCQTSSKQKIESNALSQCSHEHSKCDSLKFSIKNILNFDDSSTSKIASSSQLYGGFINSYPNLSAEKPQPTFLTSSFAPYHPSLLNEYHHPSSYFSCPVIEMKEGTRKSYFRRSVFSDNQRKQLEDRFQRHKYISKPDRRQLALDLGLNDAQVKIWFQNRRMKWRHSQRSQRDSDGNCIDKLDKSFQNLDTLSD
ncbi:Homeobox protein DBX1 [Trichinella papuae]|uniref:Homeobox protein DBX1 n=1 Tax=Trichinella papuae TaxID=268474 RepID=A0A0V1N1J6_9BILA|nr:Homeobox protein DBX1 [Trichinella papuae]